MRQSFAIIISMVICARSSWEESVRARTNALCKGVESPKHARFASHLPLAPCLCDVQIAQKSIYAITTSNRLKRLIPALHASSACRLRRKDTSTRGRLQATSKTLPRPPLHACQSFFLRRSSFRRRCLRSISPC